MMRRLLRCWLREYAQRERCADEARALVADLRGRVRVGRKLTRDEMNER